METLMEFVHKDEIEQLLDIVMYSTTRIRDILVDTGVPVEAINIENWTKFDKQDVYVKLWTGEDHIRGTGRPGLNFMTRRDVVELLRRRQILQRKF